MTRGASSGHNVSTRGAHTLAGWPGRISRVAFGGRGGVSLTSCLRIPLASWLRC